MDKPVFRLHRKLQDERRGKVATQHHPPTQNRTESFLARPEGKPAFRFRSPFLVVTHLSSRMSLKSLKDDAQSLAEARKRASGTKLLVHDLRALSRIVIAVDVKQWVPKWGLYQLLERYTVHGKQIFHQPLGE